MIIALVCLLVVLCLGVMGLSVWAVWVVFTKATQYARYDQDATQQALKMTEILDKMVRARISVMRFMVDKDGTMIDAEGGAVSGKGVRFAQQPTDPNLRSTTIIDDLHEQERETQRVIGEAEFDKRDNFAGHSGSMANNQPPPPVEV